MAGNNIGSLGNNLELMIALAILGFAVFFLFLAESPDKLVTATTYDTTGDIVSVQSLTVPSRFIDSQSIFSSELLSGLSFQSTYPTSDNNELKLNIKITNPYDYSLDLFEVRTFKNKVLLHSQDLTGSSLSPGREYSFTTDRIRTTGLEAQPNLITVEVDLKDPSGNELLKGYQFTYFNLNKCKTTLECDYPNLVCDKGNNAEFSDSLTTYCAISCSASTPCPSGGNCLGGVCGYQ